MKKLSIENLHMKDKRVLMRVDFNVPLDSSGGITDDTRIKEALPSIRFALEQGAALILMSHLGRPKGKPDPKFSLFPCAKKLGELLGQPIHFATDCVGKDAQEKAAGLKSGEVLLLENLRFYPAEEKPDLDPSFAEKLAQLGDLYINDAFGTAHRAHASTYNVASYFPGKAAAGFLMQKEISFLTALLENVAHPFYAIIGGAKISSKMGVLRSLLDKVDALFIGGGMAYPFFKGMHIPIGDSLCEEEQIPHALELLKEAEEKRVKIWLPQDIVIANSFSQEAEKRTISIKEGIPSGWQGMDIGPQTLKEWESALKKSSTIFWNGP